MRPSIAAWVSLLAWGFVTACGNDEVAPEIDAGVEDATPPKDGTASGVSSDLNVHLDRDDRRAAFGAALSKDRLFPPEGPAAFDWPFCCTQKACGTLGAVCNPESCKCELVECSQIDEPCDASMVPGVSGDLVCARFEDTQACYIRSSAEYSWEDCPAPIYWCTNRPEGCLCGYGCRYFMDDCTAGKTCVEYSSYDDPTGRGYCAVDGRIQENQRCSPGPSPGCAHGLICLLAPDEWKCVRPNCGLAEGAPDCEANEVCQPYSPLAQLGFCRTPCSPFSSPSPCRNNEICRFFERGPEGRPGALCTKASDTRLPAEGEWCSSLCQAELTCARETCLRACNPAATSTSEPGACASGSSCMPERDRGSCVVPCDPFGAEGQCADSEYCKIYADAFHQTAGGCLPKPAALPGLDEWCEDACDFGLVCAPGRRPQCRAACDLSSGSNRCPEEERCFSMVVSPGTDPTLLGYGFCAAPCVVGGSACPNLGWCEPREIDATTGSWIGTCL